MDDIRSIIPPQSHRLLDQFRLYVRQNSLAWRTEQTYVHWVKRFLYFHHKKHPKDMGAKEIEAFLTDMVNVKYCSINTQRPALNALVYLYKRLMGVDVGKLEFSIAKNYRSLPVVYSREEIVAIVKQLKGVYRL